MSIVKKLCGVADGCDVYSIKLDNEKGLKAEILTYGGIIKNLWYNGVDVLLGRDSLEGYFEDTGYMGALIGRNSNRIYNAEFMLNGEKYTLNKNDGEHNLHGGKCGFDRKVWDFKLVDKEEPSLILSLVSDDMEEGYPGKVKVKVTYTLTKENSIKIHYEGTTNKDTILSMTNHAYFNLNGHDNGLIDDHILTLQSSFYTPNTPDCMPYGEILKVDGTPFDFRNGKTFKEGFESDFDQIKLFGGYDHNLVLDGFGYRKVGTLKGDKTNIQMEIYTDLPGVQIYSGNVINEKLIAKDGKPNKIHQSVCLETQVFPNGINYSHFPSPILKKSEKYDTTTEYKFI